MERLKKMKMNALYAARRRAFWQGMEMNSVLVLYSGEAFPRSMDSSCAFEANTHFFYLTGLRRENMALVLKKTGPVMAEVLFIEEPQPLNERWTGRRVRREEAAEISGVVDVRFLDALPAFLSRVNAREQIDTAYFDCYRNNLSDAETYNAARAKDYAAAYPGTRIRNAHPALARMRMVKDETEQNRIRAAIGITDRGLRRILATLEPGKMEYQEQAEFEYSIAMDGAEGVAFPTIAGSGLNGCMLHYEENNACLEDGTLLLLDLGARKDGYCADITRTYPVNGRYTARQKTFYDIVLRANREIATFAAPGKTLKELNERCKAVLAEGMMALGKIAKPEEIGKYYMHSVSHHLGIDVHDAAVDEASPLRPGMIISDEPGLYIDEEAIGIRIEDDLLITESGCVVLSEQVPRTTEEIEAIMAESRKK